MREVQSEIHVSRMINSLRDVAGRQCAGPQIKDSSVPAAILDAGFVK